MLLQHERTYYFFFDSNGQTGTMKTIKVYTGDKVTLLDNKLNGISYCACLLMIRLIVHQLSCPILRVHTILRLKQDILCGLISAMLRCQT